jgi:hypothetical protein
MVPAFYESFVLDTISVFFLGGGFGGLSFLIFMGRAQGRFFA